MELGPLEAFLNRCQRELLTAAAEVADREKLANLLEAVTLQYNLRMEEYRALRDRWNWQCLNADLHLNRPHPIKSATSARRIGADDDEQVDEQCPAPPDPE